MGQAGHACRRSGRHGRPPPRRHATMKSPWWAIPGIAAIVLTLASVSAAETSLNSARVPLPREVQLLCRIKAPSRSVDDRRDPDPAAEHQRSTQPVVAPSRPVITQTWGTPTPNGTRVNPAPATPSVAGGSPSPGVEDSGGGGTANGDTTPAPTVPPSTGGGPSSAPSTTQPPRRPRPPPRPRGPGGVTNETAPSGPRIVVGPEAHRLGHPPGRVPGPLAGGDSLHHRLRDGTGLHQPVRGQHHEESGRRGGQLREGGHRDRARRRLEPDSVAYLQSRVLPQGETIMVRLPTATGWGASDRHPYSELAASGQLSRILRRQPESYRRHSTAWRPSTWLPPSGSGATSLGTMVVTSDLSQLRPTRIGR